MSKRQVIMILGVWVAVFLFLGFPASWDKILAVVTGVIIAGISYKIRSQDVRSVNSPVGGSTVSTKNNVPYVEFKTGEINKTNS